jgi:hypothetical protein
MGLVEFGEGEREDGSMLVGLVDQVKSWAIGVVESEYLFVGDGHEHIFPHNAAVRLRFTMHLHCHERIAAC